MSTEIGVQLGESLSASNVDEAFVATLKCVMRFGHHVETYPYEQSSRARSSKEILNFQLSIHNPLDRILTNSVRRFNCVEAVARVVWMLAANNRAEDIAFYQSKAREYADNRLSLSGSNYGQRIFESRPGLNQAEGVLNTLRREVGSRRAAIVIWSPEDAVRESNDIPCAFGLFFHQRNDYLTCTTIMRSNNAFLLLPYNIFEFSLLGEMIARTLGIKLGPYMHISASMHVYDDESDRAYEAITVHDSTGEQSRLLMPPMPSVPAPFEQAEELAYLEALLRHDYALYDPEELHARSKNLHEYWQAFYEVLLVHALCRAGRITQARDIAGQLPGYFRESMESLP